MDSSAAYPPEPSAYERVKKAQFRVVSRAPGEQDWRWRPATNAGPHGSLDAARRAAVRFAEATPGWEFKVEGRVVITYRSPWVDAPHPDNNAPSGGDDA